MDKEVFIDTKKQASTSYPIFPYPSKVGGFTLLNSPYG